MLPAHHKLHRAADFTVTMRRGRVGRTETLMVHLLVPGLNVSSTSDTHTTTDITTAPGGDAGLGQRTLGVPVKGPLSAGGMAVGRAPRFGLVISKAVGNAVVRHRTARRLRHICARLVTDVDEGAMVVIRAYPAAGTASSSQLERDLRRALSKARDKIVR